jgi:serine/threonine protein phosphatase 1
MTRLIAVGDIHGEVNMLNNLLGTIQPRHDDQFVFLGDYIDRGEDSARTIDYLLEFQRWLPSTIFLEGNHERMMLSTGVAEATDEDWLLWLQNGGDKTTDDYMRNYPDAFPDDHREFLWSLKLWQEIETVERTYVFVHAGLSPFKPIEPQLGFPDPSVMLWGRQHHEFPLGIWEDGYTVVCGHTPQREPKITERLICLDTGAAFRKRGLGRLTAMDLLSGEVYQVESSHARGELAQT